MQRNNNEINQLFLSPIVIFEGHGNTQPSLMVLDNLPLLIKMGYQVVSLEFDATRNLENVIHGLENAVRKADEAINLLRKFFAIDHMTPPQILKELIDKIPDISMSQKPIYKAYVLRKPGNEAKLTLLKAMQSANISYLGLDKEGIDKSDKLSLKELLLLNEEREKFMTENFVKFCEKYNGGIIAIFGAGHYNILKKLAKEYPDTEKKYHIISFLMLDSKELNGSFKKLQFMHGNSIEDLNCLSNTEMHTLILDQLDQSEVNKVFSEKLNISNQKSENKNEIEASTMTHPTSCSFSFSKSLPIGNEKSQPLLPEYKKTNREPPQR